MSAKDFLVLFQRGYTRSVEHMTYGPLSLNVAMSVAFSLLPLAGGSKMPITDLKATVIKYMFIYCLD